MLALDLLRQLRNNARLQAMRLHGIRVGADARIESGVRARPGVARGQPGRITSGIRGHWEQGVLLDAFGGSIRLGDHVYLGPYTVVYGHGGVELGDECLVGPHCCILSSNHALPPLGTDIRSQPDELRPTKIGRDVWLGAGVIVLGGVTIGDGCTVGAGAVVTKDLPAGSICYGSPATVHDWRPGATRTP